MKQMKSTIEAG